MPYAYASGTGSLKEFLEKVKSKDLGVPEKVTQEYLESIGYKSKNDRPIIRILKSIKFIDENNAPTAYFADFRTEKSGQVMAKALREAYADLFRLYAKPLQKSREDLENFFAKGEPSLKKATLGLFVDTFKTLCEFADFETEIAVEEKAEVEEVGKEKIVKKGQLALQMPEGLAINLNIQITLPITDNAEVYDKIFEALKKHIFTRS